LERGFQFMLASGFCVVAVALSATLQNIVVLSQELGLKLGLGKIWQNN